MPSSQLDLIIFTLGNMIAVIVLSALLLTLGWIGFLALWLTIHSLALGWCGFRLIFGQTQFSTSEK